ncbi:DNA (cytosine-5-)-methyltransferase [Idiomarina loihiensis]|jgi:DNA (cytosine-5)-methyltransferase 1|uniref:Cytosine-specific methyltransferase n=1 Tax=Idiomarina loihiensis (strain ATCC BAA-735 / DSM 15497 / L2-TR) TaxID=283942 RepID=Q5QUQ6_IDILO|nr:DNA (cytosine-5-)-methyltransferase [Idiomarina loihiensis]AAV83360.1 DNA cytosine methylase [Idiomarina loihiensis L2TR]AGM37403.1 DNA cytosine methylase [Idiomarina loihiensis GSL 199]
MSNIELKQLRERLCLTQSQAASLVHSSVRAWQQWESGERQMHPAIRELFTIKTKTYQRESRTMSFAKPSVTFRDLKKNYQELAESTHRSEQANAKDSSIKFIDLFAGVGGIRLAFEKAGAACVFSSEIDTHAQLTYFTNHGTVPYGDITKIDADSIPSHDILCAGFPCQPFSHIGRREGFKHPTQGTMFHEIVRIAEKKRPRVLFLENVPGIVNHDNGNTLKVILDTLTELGYECNHTILNASDFGVPQNRKRFYLVAFDGKDCGFSFPQPPMIKADIGTLLEKGAEGYSISEHLQKTYLFKKDDGRPILIDRNTKGPMRTLVSSYHKIQRLTGTFVKDGETGIRLLTAYECKKAMGFPDDFKFPVSRTQMYRQMGNSVVITVIDAIAEKILETLSHKKSPTEKKSERDMPESNLEVAI